MKNSHGFTLIELMVVVVVIGIISAIAIPSYTDYVTRGRIPAATAELATRRVQMEQFFQDNRTYANAPACPVAAVAINDFFNVSCAAAPTAAAFTLQAVGRAGSAMAGFTYTINEAGARTTTFDATRTTQGWAATGVAAGTATPCWITRKGGQC